MTHQNLSWKVLETVLSHLKQDPTKNYLSCFMTCFYELPGFDFVKELIRTDFIINIFAPRKVRVSRAPKRPCLLQNLK